MTLTCLIPAYNEAARIGAVLQAVLGHPLIDEVLVVDDGSRDGTAEVVRQTPARLIVLSPNGGKTAALVRGLAEATGEFVLLVDADLVGLSAEDLTALIAPVLAGRADVSISLRQNAPFLWRWLGLDYISGERVLRKSVLAGQEAALLRLPKFGFEVFLNGLLIAGRARIAVVAWPGVVSPLKARKYGVWAGAMADLRMMADLFRVVPPLGLVRQILRMRKLRV